MSEVIRDQIEALLNEREQYKIGLKGLSSDQHDLRKKMEDDIAACNSQIAELKELVQPGIIIEWFDDRLE